MKHLILLPLLFIVTPSLFALTVTPDISNLNCGTTTITFTFDCPFTGSILIPASPTGVTYSGSNVKTVNNGTLTFDLTLSPSTGSNFSLNFVVITSDMMTCAQNSDAANASFTKTCIVADNNDCANAITLDISTDSCVPMSFSTLNTNSSGFTPSCGVPGYNDLFYTFNANNAVVTMEIPNVPGTVGFYGLYDGCPSSGSEIGCSIMIASSGSTFNFTNLNVGTDYYLQILFLPGNAGIDQEICFHSATPQVNPCPTTTDVSDTGVNLPNQSYSTSESITTSGICILTSNGVVFDAGIEINLNPGFDTSTFDFEAVIGGCTP